MRHHETRVRASRRDGGAAAVEFALVLPLLLLLVFGIIDFGRLYFTQVTLTDAAREGVRVLALQDDVALATTTTLNATSGVSGTITVTTTTCTVGQPVTLTATTDFSFLTPLPDLAGILGIQTVKGVGVMRCGG